MKTRLLLLVIILSCTSLFSQTSGGPDIYGYTWKNSNHISSPPSFNWLDITTTGNLVTGLSDDNVVGPFSLPAGFPYYWYNVNQFWIGSNGYISFTGDNIASPFPALIPLSTGANDWLGVMMADLNFSGAGNPAKCYYYSNADTLCVSYIDVPFWANVPSGYTGSNTFQVILSRVDSSITYNFLSMNLGTVTLIDNIVGIENNSGSIGLQSIVDALPADSLTIKYDYPGTVTFSAIDAGMNWNGNNLTGGVFVKRFSDTIELKTNVRNFGNTALGAMTIDNTVRNNFGTLQTSGTTNLGSLAVGQDSTLTFTNTFTPTSTGIFEYSSTVNIAGDVVPGNNRIDQKIISIDTAGSLMSLDYSDGFPDGTGLGWNGGNGGIAIYIEPPMHPVRVVSSRFYISANATPPVGFHALIFDDDGPNGGPGTLLDSVFKSPTSVNTNAYNTVAPANNNLLILDGGVYLFWLMDGSNINLGRDLTPPISRRTFEVLFGGWATYRDFLTEDFLMGLNVVNVLPKANFSADASLDPEVSFTDLSSNSPDRWRWDFGDGSPVDTTQNPMHTYTTLDTFEVCLWVSNFAGSDSICKDVPILNIPPIADFAVSTVNEPNIAFSDLSINNPTSWRWDFGDGDTAITQNTTHQYKENGTYNVCLVASNVAGSSAAVCKDVEISAIGVGLSEELESTTFKVFPNPTSGITVVELTVKKYSQLNFKCFDIKGNRIDLNYDLNENGILFNSTSLSSGNYLFEVFDGETKLGMGRFIVQ